MLSNKKTKPVGGAGCPKKEEIKEQVRCPKDQTRSPKEQAKGHKSKSRDDLRRSATKEDLKRMGGAKEEGKKSGGSTVVTSPSVSKRRDSDSSPLAPSSFKKQIQDEVEAQLRREEQLGFKPAVGGAAGFLQYTDVDSSNKKGGAAGFLQFTPVDPLKGTQGFMAELPSNIAKAGHGPQEIKAASPLRLFSGSGIDLKRTPEKAKVFFSSTTLSSELPDVALSLPTESSFKMFDKKAPELFFKYQGSVDMSSELELHLITCTTLLPKHQPIRRCVSLSAVRGKQPAAAALRRIKSQPAVLTYERDKAKPWKGALTVNSILETLCQQRKSEKVNRQVFNVCLLTADAFISENELVTHVVDGALAAVESYVSKHLLKKSASAEMQCIATTKPVTPVSSAKKTKSIGNYGSTSKVAATDESALKKEVPRFCPYVATVDHAAVCPQLANVVLFLLNYIPLHHRTLALNEGISQKLVTLVLRLKKHPKPLEAWGGCLETCLLEYLPQASNMLSSSSPFSFSGGAPKAAVLTPSLTGLGGKAGGTPANGAVSSPAQSGRTVQMDTNHRILDLSSLGMKALAKLLHTITTSLFKDIAWQSLLYSATQSSSSYRRLVAFINNVADWVKATMDSLMGNPKSAAHFWMKLVGLCMNLFELHNFCLLPSLLLQLQAYTYKKTLLKYISKSKLSRVAELAEKFSYEHNYVNYRLLMSQQVAPCIPHMAVHVRDIIHFQELKTLHEGSGVKYVNIHKLSLISQSVGTVIHSQVALAPAEQGDAALLKAIQSAFCNSGGVEQYTLTWKMSKAQHPVQDACDEWMKELDGMSGDGTGEVCKKEQAFLQEAIKALQSQLRSLEQLEACTEEGLTKVWVDGIDDLRHVRDALSSFTDRRGKGLCPSKRRVSMPILKNISKSTGKTL